MEGLCFEPRYGSLGRPDLRLDILPERLPSLSEYLNFDDFPSPQLKEDLDGNLIVQFEKDHHPQVGGFPKYEPSMTQDSCSSRSWTDLDSNSAAPIITVSSANKTSSVFHSQDFRGTSGLAVTGSSSFPVSVAPTSDQSFQFPTSVSWNFPTPQTICSVRPSIESSVPEYCNLDVSSTTIDTTVSTSLPGKNCAVTWSNGTTTQSGTQKGTYGTTSSRRRPAEIPANMDDQEVRKLEMKRAKNREAAQRCQQRKQERIARLEGKVGKLREQNVALAHTVTQLREQIAWLQRQLMSHANNGCQLSLPRYLLS